MRLNKSIASIMIATAVPAVWLGSVFPARAALNFGDADKQFKQAAGSGGAGLDVSSDPEKRVGQIIQVALSFVGVAFFLLMLYGGFLWMTARGDETQAKKAKDIIIMATIGMVIILLSYTATYLVATQVFNAPG
ncbi:MAG: hypothetical protein HY981_04480 [Candidatus Magasanikbacteria bacterium]|nr:hypothetical protein [Candidatus Magasanikbacteria bacterium]